MTVSLPTLAPIERPNGKLYRPRKIVVEPWENDGWANDGCGAVVLGTHDVEAARALATERIRDWFDSELTPTKPEVGWFRLAYGGSRGEMNWVRDEVHGRAGVMFTADYPEAVPS